MSRPTETVRRDTARAAARQRAATGRDERVHASLESLVRLQHRARGFTFLPRQPIHSLLAGRHASRMRGRGLNFEELRAYQPGDDIRTIDWKVTARTRSPHTRVFTEERDRPVLLVVDQRLGMFFGTRVRMKSVAAAHLAALGAWRVLDSGDRVGALVFDDEQVEEIPPLRSRNTVMRILRSVISFNHALSADRPGPGNPAILNRVLERAARIAKHDFLVAVISDFHGADDETRGHLRRIGAHNDLLGCLVHDPAASRLPRSRDFVITDGELQIELPLDPGKLRERVEDALEGRIADVLRLGRDTRMPVLPINTEEEVVSQVQRLLGHRRRR